MEKEPNLRRGAREGKNYEQNATGHRATPNLICPHPRPPLGFSKQNYIRRHQGLKRPPGAGPDCAQLHPRWDFIKPYLVF